MASAALVAELETWPKPGLVSHVDSGSHDDMDHTTFRRSTAAIRPFFASLAIAGAAGAEMERLRQIGRDAEDAMLAATGGVNTHRGAIFGLGLLCAAAGAASARRAGAPVGRAADGHRRPALGRRNPARPDPAPQPRQRRVAPVRGRGRPRGGRGRIPATPRNRAAGSPAGTRFHG